MCGILAYYDSTFATFFNSSSSSFLHKTVWFFIIVGMLEEFVKHLVLRFSDEDKITNVQDAVEFAIIAALGFAFIEHIVYFVNLFVCLFST